MQLDLPRIWREQAVPTALVDWMLDWGHRIHRILNMPPGSTKNPSEFAKKEFCWTLHVTPLIEAAPLAIQDYGVTLADFAQESGGGRRDEKRNRALDLDIALAGLISRSAEIRKLAEARQLLSEVSARGLDKLQAGRLTLTRTEKNAVKILLERLDIAL